MTWVMVAKNLHGRTICSRTLLVIFTLISTLAVADEGGISLWLPGQFGSLAAAPQQPGWSFANIYYHTSVSAGGDVAAARQFTTMAFTRTATANLNASLNAHADLDFVSVNRVFETRVLGGQLAVGVTSAAGYNSTSISARWRLQSVTSLQHERAAPAMQEAGLSICFRLAACTDI